LRNRSLQKRAKKRADGEASGSNLKGKGRKLTIAFSNRRQSRHCRYSKGQSRTKGREGILGDYLKSWGGESVGGFVRRGPKLVIALFLQEQRKKYKVEGRPSERNGDILRKENVRVGRPEEFCLAFELGLVSQAKCAGLEVKEVWDLAAGSIDFEGTALSMG